MGERAKVARTIVLAHPRKREPRERVIEVAAHEQEALVVAEADVVARAVFLDQLALEKQRLGLALDRVGFHVPDGIDQGGGLRVGTLLPRRVEILADTLVQISRLAHVDDAVEAVLE